MENFYQLTEDYFIMKRFRIIPIRIDKIRKTTKAKAAV